MRLVGSSKSKGDTEAMGLGRPVGRNTGLQGDHFILHTFFMCDKGEFGTKWPERRPVGSSGVSLAQASRAKDLL